MALSVSCISLENYQVQVRAEKHSWIADEPEDIGGDNLGPNPFELLLGALGSCMVITVYYYASKSEIPLERLVVDLTGRDGEAKDDPYHIDAVVRVRGELDEHQLKGIEKAAHRCPVHKIVKAGADVEISVENL